MASHRFKGRPASPGLATGVLHRDELAKARRAPASSIVGAMAQTLNELRALQGSAGQLGAEILQFQVELLQDDTLAFEMLESVQGQANPSAAVAAVFDSHIAGLEAGNEHFAARAADLADMRERLVDALGGYAAHIPAPAEGSILIAEDMTPSRFLEIDWQRIAALVTEGGSPTSHVALLARSQGVPMVTGVGALPAASSGRPALLDGFSGELTVDPETDAVEAAGAAGSRIPTAPDEQAAGPALLPNGECVRVNLSVNALADLHGLGPEPFDSIGLVRTELLLPSPKALHQVDVQRAIYARLFDWADWRPVTIRLLDAGGDKPIRGFTLEHEANPFLGTRGARLLARRPDVLQVQLQAILEAADGRAVRILVPMVTLPREIAWFRDELAKAVAQHGGSGQVLLGMMVETPAAALDIDRFDADFHALGTNDLVQYTLAAARDGAALNPAGDPYFGEPLIPAVLDMIRKVVAHGAARGSEVTMCGDASGSPPHLRQILDCGVRSFTVPGRLVSDFKRFVRTGESSTEANRPAPG